MGYPGPMTHRQFMVLSAWLRLDLDRPGKAEYYAMQTAMEVRRVLSRQPSSITLDAFQLTFKERAPEEQSLHKQQVATLARAQWMARMTKPVVRKQTPGPEVHYG